MVDVAPHTGSADWNLLNQVLLPAQLTSLPIRGARIGIQSQTKILWSGTVAPHTGSADWNSIWKRAIGIKIIVAPHTGSADWNNALEKIAASRVVAPHTGSADWNFQKSEHAVYGGASLPIRGARIGI